MPTNEVQLVDFLLLGGGLANATAAETLRAAGVFEGSEGSATLKDEDCLHCCSV
jgi:hypothetical protein